MHKATGRAVRARILKPEKTARFIKSAQDRHMDRLRNPAAWKSFALWSLAMERKYGPHHRDWPAWGVAALAAHVGADLARVGADVAKGKAATKKPATKKPTSKKPTPSKKKGKR